jgi:hypothetical protein
VPTLAQALQLMIDCEGNEGVRYGRMMPTACASRWRTANGKQDGASSVKESKCKGCPHGEARATTEATAANERRELGRLNAERQRTSASRELDPQATDDVDESELAPPAAQEEEPEEQEVEMKKNFGTRTCEFDECGKQYEPTSPRQRYHTPACKLAAMRKAKGGKGGGRVVQRPKRVVSPSGAERRDKSHGVTERRLTSHDVTPEGGYTVRIGRLEVQCRSVDDVIALAERLGQ